MSTLDSSAARAAIFSRLRAGLQRDKLAPPAGIVEATLQARRRGPMPHVESAQSALLDRFISRSRSLSSTTATVATLDEVPAAVCDYLAGQNLPTSLVMWPEYASLPWAASGLSVRAGSATGSDLVGLTGCFCAIAETGTLMLCSGPDTPATVSLLPETHIAIVDVTRLVPAMEDAFDRLRAAQATAPRNMPRAVNFVSGPSRTADIEQTIVLGAHGPYRVHLILVGAPSRQD